MPDIFISYTCRGLVDATIIAALVNKIKRRFKATYGFDLTIWHQSASAAGEDFKFNIKRALHGTAIFIPLLEAEYLNAPYTRFELEYYQAVKKKKQVNQCIVPLIIWRGQVEEELLAIAGSTTVALYYSKITEDLMEVELEEREEEKLIVDLVAGIYRGWLEQARIRYMQLIENRLKNIQEGYYIFVPVTTRLAQKQRQQFIDELSKTIANRTTLKPLILPDQIAPQEFSYQQCLQLLCEENSYGAKAMQAMLDISDKAVFLIASDDVKQAEKMLQAIKFQFQSVIAKVNLSVQMCVDVPKEVVFLQTYQEIVEYHPDALRQPVKVRQERDIASFINAFLADLHLEINKQTALPATPVDQHAAVAAVQHKKIYIIDHFFTEEDKAALSQPQMETLLKEADNKNRLFTTLRNRQLGLLKCPPTILPLKEAVELKQFFIDQCDGIIIYRGASEADDWYFNQQVETHKYLSTIKRDDLKNRARAVCIDPLQNNRNHAEYFFFDFEVIDKQPEDLERFVCKL